MVHKWHCSNLGIKPGPWNYVLCLKLYLVIYGSSYKVSSAGICLWSQHSWTPQKWELSRGSGVQGLWLTEQNKNKIQIISFFPKVISFTDSNLGAKKVAKVGDL